VTASTGSDREIPPSATEIARAGWSRLMENPVITWGGFTGIVLGLIVGAIWLARGGEPIPPEGELGKAITFNIGVGIYLLTIALIVPTAGFSEKQRRRWTVWAAAIFAYSYSLETIQTLRGIDPRFTRVGGPIDRITGNIFALVAIGMIVTFVVLARRFFFRGRPDADSPVLLAIRYGCVVTVAAFAAGLWMSAITGSRTGATGSILPLHALGFHGLQAIPAVALLLVWSGSEKREAKKWVHYTAILWLAACAAVAWQTILGRSVLEVGPATIATAFLLVAWTAIAALAFFRWTRARSSPEAFRVVS
jgi:hypothetical protein